jgi:G:T/U-mismatch repair DNA glycosylase
MPIVKHRFAEHIVSSTTEILIIGTFNPDTSGNPADFFYGRIRNHLWKLLPTALGYPNLKGKSIAEKESFMKTYNVDFLDLIAEVDVDEGQEANYDDKYIDQKPIKWREVINIIRELKYLKRVVFTRKTFSGIPKISTKILEVKKYCDEKAIPFQFLTSPARTYSESKQAMWTDFIINGNQSTNQ